jgi:hypothetical protein
VSWDLFKPGQTQRGGERRLTSEHPRLEITGYLGRARHGNGLARRENARFLCSRQGTPLLVASKLNTSKK